MTRRGPGDAPRDTRALLVWFGAAGAAAAGLVGIAWLHGEPASSMGWYVGYVVAAAVTVTASAASRLRRAAVSLVTVSLWITSVAAVLASLGVATLWDDGPRIALFAGHPNLLAADLVTWLAALAVLRPARTGAATWLVVALAVVVTGSRTGLMSLTLAWLLFIFVARPPGLRRSVHVALLAIMAGAVGLIAASVSWEESKPNLLVTSVDFEAAPWQAIDTFQNQAISLGIVNKVTVQLFPVFAIPVLDLLGEQLCSGIEV